jgi:tricorn protease
MNWKNRSEEVVFRSRMRSFNDFNGALYLVSTEGNMPEEVPLPRGGFCSFSPDDQKLAYNRIFREFRTWKRYRGGMADDIWIYDFNTKQIENITDNPAQDIIPMWIGNKIYFLSDRDEKKRMNLFVYNLDTEETRKLTDFTEFDIKFSSCDKKSIVFENGGYIYRFDTDTEKYEKVAIHIKDDMNTGRGGIQNVKDYINSYEISPDGKRALFWARGDIFTVPAEQGITRNLTNSSGVHDRNPKWSPDGKWIAFISDMTGEDEVYIIPQDGSAPAKQITKGAETYKYVIRWSPDSEKLLWSDRRLRLRYVDIETGKISEVDDSDVWEFNDYAWSPDSKWIAYSKPEAEAMGKIYLFSIESKKSYPITQGWYASSEPVFSADGKYLFFSSNRDFNPIYNWTEWNYAYQDMTRLYLVTLSKDVKSPFEPKNDEVEIKGKEESKIGKIFKGKDEEKNKDEKEIVVKVDIEGLDDRIVSLPIESSRYFNISSVGDRIYYNRKGSKDAKTQLLMYDLKELKETELGQIDGYEISSDRKKMLVKSGDKYAVIDVPVSKIDIKSYIDLADMCVDLNRREEWLQIYNECWRQMREYFYAPNMHGVDWETEREKYKPLVSYVNHRADLSYVIGELIGELNVGHTYVGGGDYPKPERIETGLLGAEILRDNGLGYYQVKKILKGANWDKSLYSPLTEIGVDIKEGDYILAVNGKSTKEVENIYQLLLNTADKEVILTVNSEPLEKNSRDVIIIPIGDESELYYYNWVQNNIKKVNEATNGKIGYIHVPDMGVKGLNEFVKHYYPQIRKKGLIIDVRGNGGGNVSPMLIERLRREIAMITFARNTRPTPEPEEMIYGPMVCLCDEFSASDGDIFSYRFKKYNLGKLIGKRTWGGVVGIRGTLPLLDGGYLNKPEFSRYDVEGKRWIIEGYGVEPDIYVDNDPAKEYAGIDEQLNKAIEVILEELETKEKEIPPIPPYPVR